MKRPWHADQQLTPELARHLITAQFPSLAARHFEMIGSGWDNTAFLVDGSVAFRFPRKQSAAELLETEAKVLPSLAAHLPLPIPIPEWHGAPSEDFEWPFLGHRLIPGRSACSMHLSEAQRRSVAPKLAEFLARLHALAYSQLPLPGDALDRANFVQRLPLIVERLDALCGRGVIQEAKPWLDLFADSHAPEPPPRLSVVHGDLYACHLLVDSNNQLSGVIDWGDVHVGDPAIDLMIVYAFLPTGARGDFFEGYGPVEERTRTIARLRAAFHSITVASYGSELGNSDLAREGQTGMRLVLEP